MIKSINKKPEVIKVHLELEFSPHLFRAIRLFLTIRNITFEQLIASWCDRLIPDAPDIPDEVSEVERSR